jgi:hypothetical protein
MMVRPPVDLYAWLESQQAAAEYTYLNDYVVAVLERARQLGLTVTPPARANRSTQQCSAQQSLPLVDSHTAA